MGVSRFSKAWGQDGYETEQEQISLVRLHLTTYAVQLGLTRQGSRRTRQKKDMQKKSTWWETSGLPSGSCCGTWRSRWASSSPHSRCGLSSRQWRGSTWGRRGCALDHTLGHDALNTTRGLAEEPLQRHVVGVHLTDNGCLPLALSYWGVVAETACAW